MPSAMTSSSSMIRTFGTQADCDDAPVRAFPVNDL